MSNRRSIEVHPIDEEIRRTDILAGEIEIDEKVFYYLIRGLVFVSTLLVIGVTWTVLS